MKWEGSSIARKTAVAQKNLIMAPERALKALTQQLDALQKLKNRNYQEANADETEWDRLTHGIIEAAFGEPSSALDNFYAARWAGDHYVNGMAPEEHQSNFELR